MFGQELVVQDLINTVLSHINYHENSYFKALKEKTFEKNDFIETQIQFYFAVLFFSRPMAAAAAKIPDPKQRLEVIRNVWEEHGEGDFNNIHGHTFSELLFRLGVKDIEAVNKRALWPATRQFNTTLAGATVLDEYLVGVGLMGIIEQMFSEISAWLGQAIVANNWLTQENLIHYDLHEELDIKHAKDFFDVIEPTWKNGSKDDRYIIEQGIWLGAFTFNELYENLYKNRKQRLFREACCPHART
tara:strand:- start:11941 stop:12675 length:735 start_codon:yes stop_codon:yes gene_type:complete